MAVKRWFFKNKSSSYAANGKQKDIENMPVSEKRRKTSRVCVESLR